MAKIEELESLRLGSPVVVEHKSGIWAGLSQDRATAFVRFPLRGKNRGSYKTENCDPAAVNIVRAILTSSDERDGK